MREASLLKKFTELLKKTFQDNDLGELVFPARQKTSLSSAADLDFQIKLKNLEKYSILVEAKSNGEPRFVRLAISQLQTCIGKKTNAVGIVAAPYLSDDSVKLCREYNMGCIDLAGNCYLKFGGIFINVQGKANLHPSTRAQKSLFTPKSTRILRVLLSHPKKEWMLVDLKKEAGVSLGQASNIKQKLLDLEYIVEDKESKRFSVKEPMMLLKKWGENYSFRENKLLNFYSLDAMDVIEQKFRDLCEEKKFNYALTLTSGANLIDPFLRYNRFFAYVKSEDDMESIKTINNWKEVSSGPNITILQAYDEGVFYATQDINGFKVVSDIQLYLDLAGYKERGEEAARKILEKRIQPQW